MKIIPDLILIPLGRIISTSFSTGVYPDALKISKIIPIYKGGSNENVNNYRPISLLSIFDKIVEKIMHSRLYEFLIEHKILHPKQFGFRKNNSTSYALLEISEKIKETIDKNKYGCGVFIDLRKAFDTVNHKILLNKMEHYGIRGTSLAWFNSYLFNRRQYVFINGESSSLLNVSCGVPQGSVLGPLLFLIYINDLPQISKNLNFFLFADDTNIYLEGDSPEKLEKQMNRGLKKLQNWLIINRLSLNIDKTNFVFFRPYNKPLKKSITLLIQKKAIQEKNAVKYLGLLIDSGLTWKAHLENLSKKISKTIGLLYKIRPYVSKDILKMLYYSLVYSHISYGIEVWGSADPCHLNNILLIQKRAARLITRNDIRFNDFSYNSSNPLFVQLGFLKVKDVFRLRISKFIYDCLNKNTPEIFHHWFKLTTNVHKYRTRSKYVSIEMNSMTRTLYINSARTTHYGLKLAKVFGAKIWNQLPASLRTEQTSYFSFYNGLKRHILTGYSIE